MRNFNIINLYDKLLLLFLMDKLFCINGYIKNFVH